MKETLLPRIQLIFILLFCLVVLAGPAVVTSFQALVLAAALAGLLLGAASAYLGWLVLARGRTAVYPFSAWSVAILRVLLGPNATRDLERDPHRPGETRRRLVGLANLAAGVLLSAAALAAAIFSLAS